MTYEELLASENIDEIVEQADKFFFDDDFEIKGSALPLYERIIELDSKNAYILNKIGNCYFNGFGTEKDEFRAKEFYKKAADLENCAAQYNLASMLEKEGNPACIELYEKSSRDGDGDGYYRIVLIYLNGEIVFSNIPKAMKYLEKAAELNNIDAQLNFANELLEGKEIPQDIERGISFMFKAAEADNAIACRNMASLFYNRKYIPRNMDNAIKWAKKASAMGEYDIIEEIALDYFNGGYGLETNKPLAIELFKYAVDQGSSVSAENMARCYLNGEVVERDAEMSKKYAVKAAHLGSSWAYEYLEEICDDAEYIEALKYTADKEKYYSAMMELQRCYEKGVHTDINESLSRKYLEEALEGEYPQAQIRYGAARYYGEIGYSEDVQEAIKYFKKASDQKNYYASRVLGRIYSNGEKIDKDFKLANNYYELAYTQGCNEALINLGNLFLDENFEKRNVTKALSYFELAEQKGVPSATYSIGLLYENYMKPRDYLKASAYYKKSMNAGNLDAQTHLGAIYFFGFLGKREAQKGIEMVLDAVSKGNELAKIALNNMYYSDTDNVEARKAFEFNLAQAHNNIPTAQFYVSKFYEQGLGTAKNKTEAKRWMKIAADSGLEQAIATLGIDAYNNQHIANAYYYLNKISNCENGSVIFTLAMVLLYGGQGLTPNIDRAIHLFRKALDLGYAPARTQLGVIYLKGKGVPKNEKYGFNLLKRNAEEGEPDAQAILGECYKLGTGTPINIPFAVKWFSKASSQGNLMAKEYLYTMYSSGFGVEQNHYNAINLLKEILSSKQVKNRNHFNFRLATEYDDIERYDLSIPIYQQLANSGYDQGQYMLGLHYMFGVGVSQNNDTAKFWIKKAAAQNNEMAKEMLKELEE